MTKDPSLPKKEQLPSDQPPNDQPPPYEDASGSSDDPVYESPPQDAQRAESPMRIQKSNHSIMENFVIIGDETPRTETADVLLSTTNATISTKLWFEGKWHADPVIDVRATNAKINLALVSLRS